MNSYSATLGTVFVLSVDLFGLKATNQILAIGVSFSQPLVFRNIALDRKQNIVIITGG